MSQRSRAGVVTALGLAQTLAWASSYYLPAMLAVPMARELGLPVSVVLAAFSLALVVSAAVGPLAGHAIDRFGGRPVLMVTNLLFASGLALMATAQGAAGLIAAWVVVGLAMGSGLYEAAFAALVRLYGHGARRSITGITLFAGFASTVGWPLSAWLETRWGWRGACATWALLHLVLGLPLNAWLPKAPAAAPLQPQTAVPAAPQAPAGAAWVPPARPRLTAALLAYTFAAAWFVATAMATHLPQLLIACGATRAAAVAAGALVGPAQVAGRLLEYGVLARLHPLLSARLAALAHPLGAAALLALGAPVVALFAALHGLGAGILTIAKGTLPLALFGPIGYGRLQGWLMLPSRVAQALAPLAFGFALERWSAGALWVSGLVSLSAFAALLALPRRASQG